MAKYKTTGAKLNEQNSQRPNNWNFFSIPLILALNFTTFVVGKIQKTASNTLRLPLDQSFLSAIIQPNFLEINEQQYRRCGLM